MLHFTKHTLMIISLLISSAFAGGNPVSWNSHPLNSEIIEIKDIENNILAVQTIANLQHNYTWFYNPIDGTATIQNPNGEYIHMFPLTTDPASNLLVHYDNNIWLLPSNTQGSTPSMDMQPDAAPSFADFEYAQCCSATSSSSPPISSPMQEALADEERVGEKRKRQEDPGSAQQINPAKRQKDSSCEIKDNYYWRIHPDNDDYIQILSRYGEVIDERKTRSHYSNSRSLSNGCLYTTLHGTLMYFKRAPSDKKCLLKAGFKPSDVEPVLFPEHLMTPKEDGLNKEIFSKVATDRSYLTATAYWRIAPGQDNRLQFCDKKGNVLHTEDVINHNGERKLNKGNLYMRDGRKVYTFTRHKSDTKDLEEHGFAPGSNKNIKYYIQIFDLQTNLEHTKQFYWRIHPNKKGYYQIIKIDGTIFDENRIETQFGKRKIINGYLKIFLNKQYQSFKRCPYDSEPLSENDFAPSHTAPILFPKELIASTPDDSDTDQTEEHAMQCEKESDAGLSFEEHAMQCEEGSYDGEDLSPAEMLLFLKYQ